MKTIQDVLAALQAEIVSLSGIAADLQAIVDAPAAAPSGVTEVDVQENGQTEKFVPEA